MNTNYKIRKERTFNKVDTSLSFSIRSNLKFQLQHHMWEIPAVAASHCIRIIITLKMHVCDSLYLSCWMLRQIWLVVSKVTYFYPLLRERQRQPSQVKKVCSYKICWVLCFWIYANRCLNKLWMWLNKSCAACEIIMVVGSLLIMFGDAFILSSDI